MKIKTEHFTFAVIFALSLYGCSKKGNDAVKPVPTISTWTIPGNTYTATVTDFSENKLYSYDGDDITLPNITIQFGTTPSAGTYDVVNPVAGEIFPAQCSIKTSESLNTSTLYSASGGTVKVTVVNGKITANYSNVVLSRVTSQSVNTGYTFAAAGSSSGTIIQQ